MDLPFSYSPRLRRQPLELPGQARIGFYLAVNVEWFAPDRPAISLFPATATLSPDPLNYGWRDYGARVGVWRVMEMLEQRSLRPSAPVNAAVCRAHPQILEEGTRRGWCWVAHGEDNSTFHAGLDMAEERRVLQQIVDELERGTGRRPFGWLGPAFTETANTPRLLSELGVRYVMDWCNDDEPYALDAGPAPLIALPYLVEVGDIAVFLLRGGGPDDFTRAVVDHFDRLYAEGLHRPAIMGLGVHPFLIGQPSRIGALERALDHILGHPGVWLATSDEIAQWYLESNGGDGR